MPHEFEAQKPSEIHLLIVWPHALDQLARILADLETSFIVRRHHRVTWSEENFSNNLTRFYGQHLPPGSEKETHCGRGAFHAFILEDSSPRYGLRTTSRGQETVNINLFDAKQKYREWTGGGHRIHATNDPREAARDIWLLLHRTPESFRDERDSSVSNFDRDLIGADGWASLPQLFETLNQLCDYAVLRNFECLPDNYFLEDHGDIDLLVKDLDDTVYVTNAHKVFQEENRVHYHLVIGGERIPFDFRYIGDNYYDRLWQENLLKTRVFEKGFYRPDPVGYFYSLLYHALIHKPRIAPDYVERITRLGAELGIASARLDDQQQWDGVLADHLRAQNYCVTVPIDRSVFYHDALVATGPLAPLRERPGSFAGILDAVWSAHDTSLLSLELTAAITDSASEYHLSRQRHCLVRPLGIGQGDRVLEIGCGCGAVTRYLGEAGANVTALEADLAQAHIAGVRCRDLPNVCIQAGDLSSLEHSAEFDWILAIGALDDPAFEDREAARQFLEEVSGRLGARGRLVVAADNTLGLRYFNGCEDDSARAPFERFQGLHASKRSYGRQELASLLSATFAHVDFWYPFPDYKFPNVILSDVALKEPGFHPEELLVKIASRDYAGRNERLFQEPLVWRELARNGLLADFSNSFLVVASREEAAPGAELLAVSYAVQRRPEFATETVIRREGSEIVVVKAPLCPNLVHAYQEGALAVRQNFDTAVYVPGTLALWRVIERRNGNAGVADMVDALAPWFDFLLKKARVRQPDEGNALAHYRIADDYQDCTPFNLVETGSGAVFIDREWRFDDEIDLGWVVTRSVFGSLTAFPGFEEAPFKPRDVVAGLCAAHGIVVADADLRRWLGQEWEHQRQVSGCLPFQIPLDAEALRAQVFLERSLVMAERDTALAERDATSAIVAKHDKIIAEIHASRSWRLTRPLRAAATFLRALTAGLPTNMIPYMAIRLRSIARRVYQKSPLPYSVKRRLVSTAYRFCGPLFRGDAHYELWRLTHAKKISIKQAGLEVVTPAADEPDIFILSIIGWDFRVQRPQHIARELAQRHRVFFVEMDLHDAGYHVRRIDDNLFVIRLPGEGIGHVQPYAGQVGRDQVRNWVLALWEFCDQVGATALKHVVIQHPFWWQIARHLSQDFQIVVDCMDDISGFSNTSPFVIELESDMLRHCDKLIVSSQRLFEKHASARPTLIRNAGQVDHFVDRGVKKSLPHFLEARGFPETSDRIRVGYVGAIAEWFDADLLRAAAQLAPDVEFHLCGAATTAEAARLALLKNVVMYGEVPYADVPGFLERMDVLCIPFQLLPIIQACDPVKFYEYSAMGKPTITTRMPELERASELVFFASSAGEFVRQIHAAAAKGKDPAFRAALRTYAEQNAWAHRGEEFEAVLGRFPKVSIVILAYGDPALTVAALHSLYAGGASYPNMEIRVVDNGSRPESLAEIHRQAASLPDVRVIENGENLGFARGNNVGLGAATGEYVLLLNNDAYVAPGAIHAMVRHLQRNPQIGAVGPLTNNIGNEAKLFVDYADMDEMRRIARAFTAGYRGVYTPLNTLGYFAVMFRRRDLDRFGGLCEDYGRGMFEDDDHCAVIRSHGYMCALAEDAFVHHHLSATFSTILPAEKQALFDRNKAIFESKWGAWVPHRHRQTRPASSTDVTRVGKPLDASTR